MRKVAGVKGDHVLGDAVLRIGLATLYGLENTCQIMHV